jgi:hypothetical protein
MLSIFGGRRQHSSASARRALLELVGLAMSVLTLSDILRADGAAARGSSQKSVIMFFMPGGPSHSDLYDLKPDAPMEV